MLLRSRRIGKGLTFEPTVVIMDGVFKVKNLRKIHYSLDNILQMLREKEVFDVSTVKLGINEANGKISVYKNIDKSPVVREDIGLKGNKENLPYPVIIEGKIDHHTLRGMGMSESWLIDRLKEKGIKNIDEVFFASLTQDLKLHVSPVNTDTPNHIKH